MFVRFKCCLFDDLGSLARVEFTTVRLGYYCFA